MISAMHVLYGGTGWLTIVDRIRERLPAGASVSVRDPDKPLEDQLRDVEVLLPADAPVDAELLRAAPRLQLVQQPAVGYEGIDLQAARDHGVPVCNTPGQNAGGVAETALLLILALAKRFPEAQHAFRHRQVGEPLGWELVGRTLGIIGLGRSGSHLAAAVKGLGMGTLGIRSHNTKQELYEVLEVSDFISLHCPLDDRTRGLIGEDELVHAKPGAFLINCARGSIVDRAALERALDSGRLAGAGLDVHWDEPPDPNDPLYARDNVVALPHIAGSTWEAFDRQAGVVADNVARLLRGESVIYRVA